MVCQTVHWKMPEAANQITDTRILDTVCNRKLDHTDVCMFVGNSTNVVVGGCIVPPPTVNISDFVVWSGRDMRVDTGVLGGGRNAEEFR